MRRIASCVILALLLAGTVILASDVGLVHAQAQTVYINSDGSVSPSSAPVSSVDNVTYTLTGNVSYPTYDGIVVERNNTVIDGNGYTVQGERSQYGYGLSLTGVSNVTIENANVYSFFLASILTHLWTALSLGTTKQQTSLASKWTLLQTTMLAATT